MRSASRWTLVVAAFALYLITTAPAAFAAWRMEGPFVGQVEDLAFSVSRSGMVYAATTYGGVWRSDDGGASWSLPGDGMTSRNVRWIEIDPNDDQKIWVGLEARGGVTGMWRSSDGGASWQPVSDALSGSGARMSPLGQPIAFAPPSTIYVPATNQHYRSDDGGKTWTDFRVPNQDAYVFAVDPSNPEIVLAGGRGETLNVSRSTDGGKTWKQTGVGLGKNSLHALFFDPADPSIVYAVGGTFGKAFKSTDGGDEFSEMSLPVSGTKKLFSLTLDPADSKVLWAATQAGLFRSGDGGVTWRESGEGLGRYLCKTVAFSPGSPSYMLAATGGTGVYRSSDGGKSWSPSSQGLAAGWTKGLFGSEKTAVVFAQMSVGLFSRGANGSWSEVVQPFEDDDTVELAGIAFDPTSPKTAYAFDTSKLWSSSNGGQSWAEMQQKGPSLRDMAKGNTDSAQFASFVVDPGNAKVLYAGSWSNRSPGSAVFKTTDGGKKWQPAGNGLPVGERVSMLRSAASGTVYAVVEDQGVFRTTDGGGSWSPAGSGLAEAEVHALAVDPTSPSRLFAATENGLFRSADSGGSWERVTGGIEGDDVEAVIVDPAKGTVFSGTFHGVFASSDGGTTWGSLSDGLLNTDVRFLLVAGTPARLWAGTAGGSVYSVELP